VEISHILVAAFSPPATIEVKFCTAKRTHVPVGHAKFHINRCNESPLRIVKLDFQPVSKFNTGSFLPVTSCAGGRHNMPLPLQVDV